MFANFTAHVCQRICPTRVIPAVWISLGTMVPYTSFNHANTQPVVGVVTGTTHVLGFLSESIALHARKDNPWSVSISHLLAPVWHILSGLRKRPPEFRLIGNRVILTTSPCLSGALSRRFFAMSTMFAVDSGCKSVKAFRGLPIDKTTPFESRPPQGCSQRFCLSRNPQSLRL